MTEMIWIKNTESLPRENEHVLVYDKGEGVCKGCWSGSPDNWSHYPVGSYASDSCLYYVTHWTPLPKSPEN